VITPDKIKEWLLEVEERPSSAALIIQYIGNRIKELASRNEALLDENIELRTGRKVEEYESRIANLEYQVELLKRQLGGAAPDTGLAVAAVSVPQVDTASLLVYNPHGQVLHITINRASLSSGGEVARFTGEIAPSGLPPRLLAAGSQEELLFVFDSGRTVTLPVSAIPAADGQALDWDKALLQEPRGSEELAVILPVARMSLYENAIQVSRRGFVKKIRESFLESCITKGFVGTGVKLPADKTFSLTFCGKTDRFVMLSQEGFLFCMEIEKLPVTIEEALRLSATDHIVSTFVTGQKPSLLVFTQNGRVIHREMGWVEPSNAFKTRGQPVFSRERRESGGRAVGAAAVDGEDWGAVLSSDGLLTVYKMTDLFAAGTLLADQAAVTVLGFTVLT
jgi:DNA gyrase/topoisomerase IV subunit A